MYEKKKKKITKIINIQKKKGESRDDSILCEK